MLFFFNQLFYFELTLKLDLFIDFFPNDLFAIMEYLCNFEANNPDSYE